MAPWHARGAYWTRASYCKWSRTSPSYRRTVTATARSINWSRLKLQDITLQRQNTEISKQIFQEKEYRGLSSIFTFMRLWALYIFSRSVSLFCWRKYVDRSWDYINRSQTHECWNWGWGRAIPRNGNGRTATTIIPVNRGSVIYVFNMFTYSFSYARYVIIF